MYKTDVLVAKFSAIWHYAHMLAAKYKNERFVGAIDQGTTSTRFIVFDSNGTEIASDQREHRQIFPKPGWVEHDPLEIWDSTCLVIQRTLAKSGIHAHQLSAVGITNQRETTLVWDKKTGKPLENAIVWQDTRTNDLINGLSQGGDIDRFRHATGLPLSTYFSGPKMKWLIENSDVVRDAVNTGRAMFGTIDTWITLNLTGGVCITDVTNASRTLLMDLRSMSWDMSLAEEMAVPLTCLPEIVDSIPSEPYGVTLSDGPFGGEVPIMGILGDQQAALFGQACFGPGESKNTYGTGCFLLMNVGDQPVESRHGLLSTVAFKTGSGEVAYALEGSVAVAGALVQWLRDGLGIIKTSEDIEVLAADSEDSGGVYIVPAFSGLFAPYWKSDARGIIAGLTAYSGASHIARAVLEATAFQTYDVFSAMADDSKTVVRELKVDGGMTVNETLMQFQSNILGISVTKPRTKETTALGAAFAAGLASGFWDSKDQLRKLWKRDRSWEPCMEQGDRDMRLAMWKKAVERSMGWLG